MKGMDNFIPGWSLMRVCVPAGQNNFVIVLRGTPFWQGQPVTIIKIINKTYNYILVLLPDKVLLPVKRFPRE